MREYLKELSEYLISLKDNGFEILNNETTIRIQNDRPFKLEEVKDDLIPFIHILNDDHDIIVRVKGYSKFKLFGLLKLIIPLSFTIKHLLFKTKICNRNYSN